MERVLGVLEAEAIRAMSRYPVADLCSAHAGVRVLDSTIVPLFRGTRICGPARTGRITPGQNAAIHRAVCRAAPGDVLVIAGGDTSFGPFGAILAQSCRNRGVTGLVIESTIRDTSEIRQMRFPVFSLGASPRAAAKDHPGEIDIEVTCGSVTVRPGDLVAADDDGVALIPVEIVGELLERSEAHARRERSIKARIRDGEETCEIFGISR